MTAEKDDMEFQRDLMAAMQQSTGGPGAAPGGAGPVVGWTGVGKPKPAWGGASLPTGSAGGGATAAFSGPAAASQVKQPLTMAVAMSKQSTPAAPAGSSLRDIQNAQKPPAGGASSRPALPRPTGWGVNPTANPPMQGDFPNLGSNSPGSAASAGPKLSLKELMGTKSPSGRSVPKGWGGKSPSAAPIQNVATTAGPKLTLESLKAQKEAKGKKSSGPSLMDIQNEQVGSTSDSEYVYERSLPQLDFHEC